MDPGLLNLGPHAAFIIWAYVGVALGVIGLIAYAVYDARHTSGRLAALESRGIRRRSAGGRP